MMWFRRIFLFALVNIAVITTLSLIMRLLGVQPYLTPYGISYTNLFQFCLVWGMGGSFLSLGMSRMMVKWMMRVQVIDPHAAGSPRLQSLVHTVYQLARDARLPAMPEVGIYDSPEVNAFATGPTRSRALVAVSTGLLNRMSAEELEGVLAHEVTHIANGDMVTMTLLQGIVNAFAMFLSRAIAFAIEFGIRNQKEERDSRRSSPMFSYLIQVALEVVFMLLGSMIIAWFSRRREFRADAGGAQLAGRQNMIAALERLKNTLHTTPDDAQSAGVAQFQTFKISNTSKTSWLSVFATHPPLEERIERLKA